MSTVRLFVKDTMVLAGEITVAGQIDCETTVLGFAKNIGFESLIDSQSSVDRTMLREDCEGL